MSDPLFEGDDDAATPLDPDEREGLILTYIVLRRELNEAEELNIGEATRWAYKRKPDILSEEALRALHKRMFGKVWRWAGEFRRTDRNIGVDPRMIGVELRQLLDDVRYWIAHETYPPDEIAVRFHHRLVFIHPFPNGNGRHSRLAADLLAMRLGRPPFSWGRVNMIEPGATRTAYVAALREADGHNIEPLLEFARS